MLESMALAIGRLADFQSLLMLLVGVLVGTTFGALPGLGSIVALSVVLPFTFGMDPMAAMYLYAGIMSSVTFGGSVPAILLNTPGTPPNAATCFDGYAMAKRGEGARAIAVSAMSCLVGSIGGAAVTIALLPVIKPIVFAFGPPEFFGLVVFGLVMIAFASRANMVKGLVGGGIGLLLSMVGYSEIYDTYRYTMGSDYLWDGIPLVPFVVGLFAVSELIAYTARGGSTVSKEFAQIEINWHGQIRMGIMDVVTRPVQCIRSSAIGAAIGIIPGLGGSVAAFMSYFVGMQRTKSPETYGKGNVEGIICAETANDAKEGGALLPTVAFGLPGSADMAILLGAFVLHGLQPGPDLLRNHMDLIYALLFGIILSQVFTSGLGLITAPWLARLSLLPNRWIAPFVLVLVFVGTFMVRSNILDVVMAVVAGIFGYLMRRYGFPLITIAIGYILGPLAEKSWIQSMQISDGSLMIFLNEPIALVLLLAALGTLLAPMLAMLRRARNGRAPA
jgi:putative tricarboxylic transport membrane protein